MHDKKDQLLKSLKTLLPRDRLLISEESLIPYECDGLSAYRQKPMLVALPDTIEEIQAILRICNTHRVPIVARGAGTSLSGGALPLDNALLLSLARFNRIISIDRMNRTARVQPGVTNQAISHAVSTDGLYYAPDPSSQIAS